MSSMINESQIKFDLKYKPLYGEQVFFDETDFGWPTKE